MSKLRIFALLPSVMAVTGYGKSTIWEKAADPDDDFPAPVRIGPKVSAWIEDEIIAWQERRIAERDARIAERKAAAELPQPPQPQKNASALKRRQKEHLRAQPTETPRPTQ
jgi:prophage regulatory protein